jgi:hypothetical protein
MPSLPIITFNSGMAVIKLKDKRTAIIIALTTMMTIFDHCGRIYLNIRENEPILLYLQFFD